MYTVDAQGFTVCECGNKVVDPRHLPTHRAMSWHHKKWLAAHLGKVTFGEPSCMHPELNCGGSCRADRACND
jgi:hypothetical protein